MVPPIMSARVAARTAVDALEWDLGSMRGFQQAESLVQDVASRLPFYVPRTGLLMLDWQAISDGESSLRVQPRMDLHAEPWLEVPAVAVRPTDAVVLMEETRGERQLFLQMPRRNGRAGARVPLSTGLMRMSMHAHDENVRFLPVVLRSDLSEDRHGNAALHLHSLDMAVLQARKPLELHVRKALASNIAERVLGMMSLAGAGLARSAPMLIENDSL